MKLLLAGMLMGATLTAQNAPRPYGPVNGPGGAMPPYNDLLREMSLRQMHEPSQKSMVPSNPYVPLKGVDLNKDRKKESVQYRWQRNTVSLHDLKTGADEQIGTLEVLITDGRTKEEWAFTVPDAYDVQVSTLKSGAALSSGYPYLVLRINGLGKGTPRAEAISFDGGKYVRQQARFVEE